MINVALRLAPTAGGWSESLFLFVSDICQTAFLYYAYANLHRIGLSALQYSQAQLVLGDITKNAYIPVYIIW